MHFVVKRKSDSVDASDLEQVAAQYGVEIIDRIADQAALIEASQDAAEQLKANLRGWSVTPEKDFDKPSPPYPRSKWKLDDSP